MSGYLLEKYPKLLELFYLLDIWHKAKKLSKCLHQVSAYFKKAIFLSQIV